MTIPTKKQQLFADQQNQKQLHGVVTQSAQLNRLSLGAERKQFIPVDTNLPLPISSHSPDVKRSQVLSNILNQSSRQPESGKLKLTQMFHSQSSALLPKATSFKQQLHEARQKVIVINDCIADDANSYKSGPSCASQSEIATI